VLRHQPATLVFSVLTLVATVLLYGMVSKGFLPQQDTGLLIGVTDAAQDISFPAMQARQQAIADIVARDPAVVAVDSFVGAGSINPTLNSGRLYINIGAADRGRDRQATVMARLLQAVAELPGISLHLQPAQDIQIETRTSRTQYQYVPTSPATSRPTASYWRCRSTGRRRPASASRWPRSTRRSMTPSANARSPPSMRPPSNIMW
jgi:multidrug efflux pump subunit AcrB